MSYISYVYIHIAAALFMYKIHVIHILCIYIHIAAALFTCEHLVISLYTACNSRMRAYGHGDLNSAYDPCVGGCRHRVSLSTAFSPWILYGGGDDPDLATTSTYRYVRFISFVGLDGYQHNRRYALQKSMTMSLRTDRPGSLSVYWLASYAEG